MDPFDRLRFQPPRPRASFADFVRAMHQEHTTVTTEWQLLDGGRWRATLTCRDCGSFTRTLDDADMAELQTRAPGFFPAEFKDEDGNWTSLQELTEKLRDYWKRRREGDTK